MERWVRHRGLFELPKRLVNSADGPLDVGGGEGGGFVFIFGSLVWAEILPSNFSRSNGAPVGSVGVDVMDEALLGI